MRSLPLNRRLSLLTHESPHAEAPSSFTNVLSLIRYGVRFPRCGSVTASSVFALIHLLTVVSSTRKMRPTSRTVKSFSTSPVILSSPYNIPIQRFILHAQLPRCRVNGDVQGNQGMLVQGVGFVLCPGF